MDKRRSLDDALTPEEQGFLESGVAKPAKKKRQPKKKEETTPMKSSAALKSVEPAAQQTYHLPPDYSLNTRLKSALSDGLLRATSDRKVQRHPAPKIRDIVEEAMADWLRKNGYLN